MKAIALHQYGGLLRQPGRPASIADPEAAAKGGHYVWVRPDPAGLTSLGRLADEGRLTVPLDRVLPLAEAAEAWRVSRDGHTRGKIVPAVADDRPAPGHDLAEESA